MSSATGRPIGLKTTAENGQDRTGPTGKFRLLNTFKTRQAVTKNAEDLRRGIILELLGVVPAAKGSRGRAVLSRLAAEAGTVQLLIGQLQQAMTSFPKPPQPTSTMTPSRSARPHGKSRHSDRTADPARPGSIRRGADAAGLGRRSTMPGGRRPGTTSR
jgi:hypothetical protein